MYVWFLENTLQRFPGHFDTNKDTGFIFLQWPHLAISPPQGGKWNGGTDDCIAQTGNWIYIQKLKLQQLFFQTKYLYSTMVTGIDLHL